MIDVADAARLRVVRLFGPHARTLLGVRDNRVAWTGALLVTSAFAMTGLLPMWVLALGPIVWGVPHVLSDVRYLVVKPRYHARWLVVVPVLLGVALGWAGLGLAGVLACAAGGVLVARAPVWRRLAVAVPLFALAFFAHRAPTFSTLVFAHVHNALALAFFVLWRRRERRIALVPVVLACVFAALILAGALDPVLSRAHAFGTATFDDLVLQLAPPDFCADPRLVSRLVHYVVWLRLVPEEDRPRPRSFRQSVNALRRDLGVPILALSAAFAAVLAVWAFFDIADARWKYLQVAFFHGWLEISAGAVMLVEARRRSAA
jgi:hypothetical protein